MHAERASRRDELSMESYKAFCPTFCALQKVGKRSRRKAAKNVAAATWHRRKAEISRGAAKDFIGFV